MLICSLLDTIKLFSKMSVCRSDGGSHCYVYLSSLGIVKLLKFTNVVDAKWYLIDILICIVWSWCIWAIFRIFISHMYFFRYLAYFSLLGIIYSYLLQIFPMLSYIFFLLDTCIICFDSQSLYIQKDLPLWF